MVSKAELFIAEGDEENYDHDNNKDECVQEQMGKTMKKRKKEGRKNKKNRLS